MAEPAQGEVIIYEHTRYGGRSYRTKNSIADLKSVNFDNTVSSIKVGPNTRCSLWANAHYGGASLVVKSSEDNLVAKGFNDKASSLSIQAPEQETIKADGYYSIVSVANGKALDGNVGAAQDKTHPRVFLWDHTPSAQNHHWQLKPIGDGTHYVIVNRANGKALDGNIGVPQHSAPHPTPFLWDETPSAQNHQWKFQKVDENTYVIISRANGKALDGNLDVPQSNASHPSPFLWDPVPHAANHRWKLVRAK